MTTTVVDAMLLELGFDTSKLMRGEREAEASSKRTKESLKRDGDDIERSSRKSSDSLEKLQGEVLGLFAAFTAGKGLKDFISSVVQTDASMGRMAYTLDTTVQKLGSWVGAGAMVGASAQDIIGSFQSLTSQFQQFSLTGESTVIPYFRALGINIADSRGRMRDLGAVFLDLSDKFKSMDPARAAAFGRAMGLTPGMINLLLQGRDAVQAYLATARRYAPTDADVRSAYQLQQAWNRLTISSTAMGRTFLTELTPALTGLLNILQHLSDWFSAHPVALSIVLGTLTAAVVALGVAMATSLAGAGIRTVMTGFTLMFDFIPGLLLRLGLIAEAIGAEGLASAFLKMGAAAEASLGPIGWALAALTALYFIARRINESEADYRKSHGLPEPRNPHGNVGGTGASPTVNRVTGGGFGGRGTTLPSGSTGALGPRLSSRHEAVRAPTLDTDAKKQAWAAAVSSEERYGVPAEVTYAQWALESGYGKHVPKGSNNPFGIKAKPGQPFVTARSSEFVGGVGVSSQENFAKFGSIQEAFDAHAKLLATAPAYAKAREDRGDPRAYANDLTGVYATDPDYGRKLQGLMPPTGRMAMASAGGSSSTTTHTTSNETHIGQINVDGSNHRDPQDTADAIVDAANRNSFVQQANYGPV